jgi:hypothetical protein
MDGMLPEMMRVAAMIGAVGLILSGIVFWRLRLSILLGIITGTLAIGYEVLTKGLYQTLFETGRSLYVMGLLFVLIPPLMRSLRRKKVEELEVEPTNIIEVEEAEGMKNHLKDSNSLQYGYLL